MKFQSTFPVCLHAAVSHRCSLTNVFDKLLLLTQYVTLSDPLREENRAELLGRKATLALSLSLLSDIYRGCAFCVLCHSPASNALRNLTHSRSCVWAAKSAKCFFKFGPPRQHKGKSVSTASRFVCHLTVWERCEERKKSFLSAGNSLIECMVYCEEK